MDFLLDTSALLAHYRNETGAEKVQAILEDESNKVIISSVSLTEFGRRLKDLGASVDEIRDVINEYQMIIPDIISAGADIAFEAFLIGCSTAERIPLIDTIIAATAKINGACLVHRDKHMELIPKNILNQMIL